MMRGTSTRSAICTALTLAAGRAAAQASPSEMSAFPMPPPTGFAAVKTFRFAGDYGYYTAPETAVAGVSAAASDYRYVWYRGVTGMRVTVYGTWGPTPVPPPSGGRDACGHAHTSWGVWARWEFSLPFFGLLSDRRWTMSQWTLLGGGGMSGVRNAEGRCVFTPDNPLRTIDPAFGWGQTQKSFDLRRMPFIKDLVVGVLSNTHGWGSCRPSGGFVACHEPSRIRGYTLP